MKAGWDVRPLGELCRIELGSTPSRSHSGYWDTKRETNNVWLSIADLPQALHGVAMDSKEYVSDIAAANMRLIPEGTLLASFKLTLGRLAYAGRDLFTNEAIASFYSIAEDRLSKRFLYWALTAFDWDKAAEGDEKVKGKTLNKAKLKLVPIPLPPLEEQQRIVAVLDEAFEGLARARTHAETNLQNARELFESIKANALDYNGLDRKTVVLSDVAEVTSGLVDPREAAYADLPHIGAGNMITGSDELVGVMTAREEKLISGKYLFDETMVLYSKIRPYLRKAARPDFRGLCSADVYPVKPVNAVLDRDFLFHLLLGHDFTEYAIQGSDRAGMPKVNRNHMFAYSFDLPPLKEQQNIAKVIDAAHIECQQLAELANAKVQSLDALRQSLLQKAFAGELT